LARRIDGMGIYNILKHPSKMLLHNYPNYTLKALAGLKVRIDGLGKYQPT
jgi:hypothetical protein